MVARTFLTILSLALSACAFQVTQPNANQGWTSAGPNTVVWERVDTDPTSFAIVLTNTVRLRCLCTSISMTYEAV
jgi:hypothetical protein